MGGRNLGHLSKRQMSLERRNLDQMNGEQQVFGQMMVDQFV